MNNHLPSQWRCTWVQHVPWKIQYNRLGVHQAYAVGACHSRCVRLSLSCHTAVGVSLEGRRRNATDPLTAQNQSAAGPCSPRGVFQACAVSTSHGGCVRLPLSYHAAVGVSLSGGRSNAPTGDPPAASTQISCVHTMHWCHTEMNESMQRLGWSRQQPLLTWPSRMRATSIVLAHEFGGRRVRPSVRPFRSGHHADTQLQKVRPALTADLFWQIGTRQIGTQIGTKLPVPIICRISRTV